MYQIQAHRQEGQTTLLIPAMLDDHFPLLQYAFHSRDYFPVILDQGQGAAELGLRYAHNDMCYPFHLSLGQYLLALGSGAYDLENTALLMPTVGDACRGSNFTSLIRKALVQAGYPQVKVLTLNVKGLEKDQALPIHPDMVWRALFGLFYGDLLLLLTHQTRPWEAVPGAAEACRAQWTARLAEELKTGRGLTLGRMRQVFAQAAADFAKIPLRPGPRRRVALVGELYTKYCALGNWDMVAFLEGEGWEVAVNGFSWYLLYYASNQIAAGGPAQGVWRGSSRTCAGPWQTTGFSPCPPSPPSSGRRQPGSARTSRWPTAGSSGRRRRLGSGRAVPGCWPCSPSAACPTMCAAGGSMPPWSAGWGRASW